MKNNFFQNFFPNMFFEKLKKKCSAEMPHPSRQNSLCRDGCGISALQIFFSIFQNCIGDSGVGDSGVGDSGVGDLSGIPKTGYLR